MRFALVPFVLSLEGCIRLCQVNDASVCGSVPGNAHLGNIRTDSEDSVVVTDIDLDPSEMMHLDENVRDLATAMLDLQNQDPKSAPPHLARNIFNKIYNAREGLANYLNADPVVIFREARGHILFEYAIRAKDRNVSHRITWSALLLPMLIGVKPEDFERFKLESGLTAFCATHAAGIRDGLLEYHNNAYRSNFPSWERTFEVAHVGAELPKYCPELLDQFPELVPVVVEHRLYRSLAGKGNLPESRILKAAVRPYAFSDSIGEIMNRNPATLLRFVREKETGASLGREFVSLGAEEIFRVPESIYFKDSGAGVLEILPTGPVEHYEAIGRFMGIALAHDVAIGVCFPEGYAASLLGKPIDMALEPAAQERLKLLVKGFQDVVATELVDDFLTVERLAQTFAASPQIDVEDVIANTDFRPIDNLESPLDVHGAVPQQLKWLIAYMRGLSQEELRKLTKLISGRSVAPVGGFGSIKPRMNVILLDTEPSGEALPKLFPFFSTLRVPAYETEQQLMIKFNEVLYRV